jgi:hypothetical protein
MPSPRVERGSPVRMLGRVTASLLRLINMLVKLVYTYVGESFLRAVRSYIYMLSYNPDKS